MDLGYQGMQKDLLGANVIMPHKRPRKRKGEKDARNLTDEQKKHNKKVGGIRVTVENSIGRNKAVCPDDRAVRRAPRTSSTAR